jgi:hypothetical protein
MEKSTSGGNLFMKSLTRLFTLAASMLIGSGFAHASDLPITIYPDPVSFGKVGVNTTASLQVFLSNPSSTPVTISAVSINGQNANSFSLGNDFCLTTLSAHSNCWLFLNFTPIAFTNYTTYLAISVQGFTEPFNIPVSGTGVAPLNVTSITPAYVYANSPTFTLTVNGTGFVPGDTVAFTFHEPLPTAYISPTQLAAQVSLSEYADTGSVFVESSNSYSNSVDFYVIPTTPWVGSLSPPSIIAGSAPPQLVVNSYENFYEFMPGATVMWNGAPVPTIYSGPAQLLFTATESQLASPTIAQITVQNPTPDGGLSTPIPFDVTYPVTIREVPLTVNQIIYDPNAKLIYASLPFSAPTHSNSIAVIDPFTGNILGYHFAGNDPNQLALSSDSQYLYVGLDGSGSVQRFILPGFTPDIEVSLGHDQQGFYTAYSLQVDPSDDHTWAVSVWGPGSSDFLGVYFYTDSTELPDAVTSPDAEPAQLIWTNSSTMFGYSFNTLSQITTNSDGGTLGTIWTNLVEGQSIAYANGLIYGAAGEVFNPSTGLLVGSYDVESGDFVLPDPTVNRVFVLGETLVAPFPSFTTYNLSEFNPEASANLSQFGNNIQTGPPIFWGSAGLAFTLSSSQVVLVDSTAMFSSSSGSEAVSSAILRDAGKQK